MLLSPMHNLHYVMGYFCVQNRLVNVLLLNILRYYSPSHKKKKKEKKKKHIVGSNHFYFKIAR
jgi:hypothetical protein